VLMMGTGCGGDYEITFYNRNARAFLIKLSRDNTHAARSKSKRVVTIKLGQYIIIYTYTPHSRCVHASKRTYILTNSGSRPNRQRIDSDVIIQLLFVPQRKCLKKFYYNSKDLLGNSEIRSDIDRRRGRLRK